MKISIVLAISLIFSVAKASDVVFIDTEFSKEIYDKADHYFKLVSGPYCDEVSNIELYGIKHCFFSEIDENTFYSNGHGHHVVKNFLLQMDTDYRYSIVDIPINKTFNGDAALIAGALVSFYLDTDPYIVVTTAEDQLGIWSVGDSAERSLFERMNDSTRYIFWAASNGPGNLTERVLADIKTYPYYEPIVRSNADKILFVGAEDGDTLYSNEPGSNTLLRNKYLAYSGWSNVTSRDLQYGTSFATPKLAALIIKWAAECDASIESVIKHIQKYYADENLVVTQRVINKKVSNRCDDVRSD